MHCKATCSTGSKVAVGDECGAQKQFTWSCHYYSPSSYRAAYSGACIAKRSRLNNSPGGKLRAVGGGVVEQVAFCAPPARKTRPWVSEWKEKKECVSIWRLWSGARAFNFSSRARCGPRDKWVHRRRSHEVTSLRSFLHPPPPPPGRPSPITALCLLALSVYISGAYTARNDDGSD